MQRLRGVGVHAKQSAASNANDKRHLLISRAHCDLLAMINGLAAARATASCSRDRAAVAAVRMAALQPDVKAAAVSVLVARETPSACCVAYTVGDYRKCYYRKC